MPLLHISYHIDDPQLAFSMLGCSGGQCLLCKVIEPTGNLALITYLYNVHTQYKHIPFFLTVKWSQLQASWKAIVKRTKVQKKTLIMDIHLHEHQANKIWTNINTGNGCTLRPTSLAHYRIVQCERSSQTE
jgi:hypothetical protein